MLHDIRQTARSLSHTVGVCGIELTLAVEKLRDGGAGAGIRLVPAGWG